MATYEGVSGPRWAYLIQYNGQLPSPYSTLRHGTADCGAGATWSMSTAISTGGIICSVHDGTRATDRGRADQTMGAPCRDSRVVRGVGLWPCRKLDNTQFTSFIFSEGPGPASCGRDSNAPMSRGATRRVDAGQRRGHALHATAPSGPGTATGASRPVPPVRPANGHATSCRRAPPTYSRNGTSRTISVGPRPPPSRVAHADVPRVIACAVITAVFRISHPIAWPPPPDSARTPPQRPPTFCGHHMFGLRLVFKTLKYITEGRDREPMRHF